ncbi:hypothetical protein F4825DRAFT_445982 [Nemania diffusa]|nr:hypothetical protein F4825DRAFT_445982 [Nemania diffusa]
MSQNNDDRDGRDGNRGRQHSNNSGRNGNQQKRHRSPTSDNDNSRGRQAHRRDRFDQDMQQVALMRQGRNLTASVNLDPSVRTPRLLRNIDVRIQTAEELQQDLRDAPRNSLWLSGCVGTIRPQQPKFVAQRALRERRGSRRPRSPSPAPSVPEPANPGNECKICHSRFHSTHDCAKLSDVAENKRATGFKKWCPHHEAPHAIDQCKQKWTWLRDARLVKKYLIRYCANGPAFATNLIDWRSLLDVGDDEVVDYPWTPEFAIQQALADPDFHERRLREIDPVTTDLLDIIRMAPQTENGQLAQFTTYAELQAHAEAEYQAFQITLEERRAAGKQKERAALIETVTQWRIGEQKKREDIQKMLDDADHPDVTRMFTDLVNGGPAAVPPNEAAATVQDPTAEGMQVDDNAPVVVAAPEPPAFTGIIPPVPAGIVPATMPSPFEGDDSGLNAESDEEMELR